MKSRDFMWVLASLAAGAASSAHSAGDALLTAAPASASPTIQQQPLVLRRDSAGRLLVPVTVNGDGPFYFLLDTAANRSGLSAALATRLKLVPVDGGDVVLNDTTGRSVVRTALIERLEAGTLLLENRTVPLLSTDTLGEAAGVLGTDALLGHRVTIDLRASRLTADAHPLTEPVVSTPQRPAGLTRELMTVDATVSGMAVKALFDTGSARTLGNLELQRRLEARSTTPPPADESRARGAAGNAVSTKLSAPVPISVAGKYAASVAILQGDLHVFRASGLESTPAIVLGMDVIGALARFSLDCSASSR